MHDRTALGTADLPDPALAGLVAQQLGVDDATLLESRAAVAPYDLEALTTAGRYRVTGRARTERGDLDFAFFVKVVQSWARTPAFAFVPEQLRDLALAGLPWWVEPDVYRSDLLDRLPDGLTMPTAHAVVDLDGESAALWLELVEHDDRAWDAATFARAARLLGRLAACERVRALNRVGRDGEARHRMRGYAEGRVTHQVLPALRSPDLWSHPLVSGAFDDDLRLRLLEAADRLTEIVDELEQAPLLTIHGDACSRNLLVRRPHGEMVLIDFGFFGEGPVGFDLGQLLLGEVQTGERSADCLPSLEQACLLAYVAGLADEGLVLSEDVVRRAHALEMLLFSGLSAVPFEHLHAPPTPALTDLAAQRADAAAFMLDLVDATG